MNIYSIRDQVNALEQIGITIDTPERMKLELGLIRLSQLANADQLLFWGKISTTANPYYIAMSIDFKGHYGFPHKKFFYSTDNFVFQQFPQLDVFNKDQVEKFNHLPFTGNAANILVNIQGQGQQKKQQVEKKQGEDSEQQQVIKVVPKNFTQIDRLYYVVKAIELQCQLVPVGAFRINEEHQLRYNKSFKPIKIHDIGLNKFKHFRYPLTENAKSLIQSAESIFMDDFFDPIENLTFWSLQTDTKESLVTVRSLLWPGYLAYQSAIKGFFGGIYFGNGSKMIDLCFYL